MTAMAGRWGVPLPASVDFPLTDICTVSSTTFCPKSLTLDTAKNLPASLNEYAKWYTHSRYHLGICDYPANDYFQSDIANAT